MNIRTLVRVRMTRYFKTDIYVMNRCSRADAIIVDMEKKSLDDSYKMRSLDILTKSSYNIPKLMVDTVSPPASNPWISHMSSNPKIRGIAVRYEDEQTMDELDNTVISDNDTVYTMIYDTQLKRITHSIISYHMINDHDIQWNSRLRTSVQQFLNLQIQPLAARRLRFTDTKSAIGEYELLKEIGFKGAVIQNPNLIEMTNQLFT